ncbi:unnamed protein product [Diabrotica balteata]|uniref:Carboxylesterase type B domain-containing protein n=1 Tax=Diabrotica balteata TaxID=107213 RepID=A0A9N9SZ76_DIABA|nr:unnamed protein product [Diabrotica balteata]
MDLLPFALSIFSAGHYMYCGTYPQRTMFFYYQVILEKFLNVLKVFRGVPYAAPPVGPLRFRPPQPPLSWPGTRLADTFGAVCPQKYPDVSNRTAALQFMPKGRYQYLKKLVPLLVNQSEDCLFLNIYVPGSGQVFEP